MSDYAEGGPIDPAALPELEQPAAFVIPISSDQPRQSWRLVWSVPISDEELRALSATEQQERDAEEDCGA